MQVLRFITATIFIFLWCPANATKNIVEHYPVVISISSDHSIFPQHWLKPHIKANATPVAASEVSRTKSVLKKAFSKYPENVLKQSLDSVYVVEKLRFRGVSAGGTNSKNNIYLANRGIEKGDTNRFIESVFHAELSSILLRNKPQYIDKTSWLDINPSTFKYGRSGVDAIKKGMSSQVSDTTNYNRGFFTEYATSSFENDFNSVSKRVFIGDAHFWTTVNKYPPLKEKVALVVQFYNQVDPRFTLDYFKGL